MASCAPERATHDLGRVFELMATAVKPYPSCRYGHAGIDAAIALRAEHALTPDEIEAVTLGLPKAGMILIGEPAAQKADPRNVVDGQFSGPFVIACALATGRMAWDSYGRLEDPTIRVLLPKIRCEMDPDIEAEFPANMSGKVTIHARGKTFVRKVSVPKGEPANFLTATELRAKFTSLAEGILGREQADRLANTVEAIESMPDISALARLSTPHSVLRAAGE